MGLRPSSQNCNNLVGKYIGTGYDNVKEVADNMDDILFVAKYLNLIKNDALSFIQEDIPTENLTQGARWYKPSVPAMYIYYINEGDETGSWIEDTSVGDDITYAAITDENGNNLKDDISTLKSTQATLVSDVQHLTDTEIDYSTDIAALKATDVVFTGDIDSLNIKSASLRDDVDFNTLNKLGKEEIASDSNKLGGNVSTFFAKATDVNPATTTTRGTVVKATTAEAIAGTSNKIPDTVGVKAAITQAIQSSGEFSYSSAVWDSVSDVTTGNGVLTGVTAIHENMRRCLLLDDGTVNYYLDPNNSNLKADGGASVLTGEDGQVMVEIPKCYVKVSKVGNKVTWSLSSEPKFGYVLHPAFTKDGTLQYDNKLDMWHYVGVTQEVDYVYVGAYQASVYDVSGAEYIDGLNLDDNSARVDTGADKLSSVAGKYPMAGLTRSDFRVIANNRGSGWNEIDFWTHSLLQLLYTTEYRDLNSQSAVSQGVVSISGGYPASSELQTDSPHSVAGKSNAVGNQTGGVESSTRDVPWMSYRGVENFWGNCYVWIDGINILDRVYHVNNTGTFTDDTTANGYSQLGTQAPTSSGFIRNVQNNTLSFIPVSGVGGSSDIAFSDYYNHKSTGYRVMAGGGSADLGLLAGAFLLNAAPLSGVHGRMLGGRLVYK